MGRIKYNEKKQKEIEVLKEKKLVYLDTYELVFGFEPSPFYTGTRVYTFERISNGTINGSNVM